MNRYLLFAGDVYYAAGGWNDLIGAYASRAAALEALRQRGVESWEWWHLVDTEAGRVVLRCPRLPFLAEDDEGTVEVLESLTGPLPGSALGDPPVSPPPLHAYVLATKYADGDPGDHWAVGYYAGTREDRHVVVDAEGRPFRANGFRRVAVIRPEVGAWLLSAAPLLEQAPPGTVNLWTLLTSLAFPPPADS